MKRIHWIPHYNCIKVEFFKWENALSFTLPHYSRRGKKSANQKNKREIKTTLLNSSGLNLMHKSTGNELIEL